jgi:transcriptional regulator with GAF, ATPase, and Fis domain
MLPREVVPAAPAVEVPPAPYAPSDSLASLAQIEHRHVERVLQATAWNKARAARVLEVDIKTLNKKIRDFGITRPA